MRIRFLIFLTFLLALSGALYYGCIFSKRPLTPDKAYYCLLNGEIAAAQQSLRTLPAHRLVLPLNLYLGYLEQATGNFDQAAAYFNHLLTTPAAQQQEVLVQSHLALALGAYQTHREAEARDFVQKAKQDGVCHPSFIFFDALHHYYKKNYTEASRLWSTYDASKHLYQNDWLMALIHTLYPPCWIRIHLAHCFIERGDIKTGRAWLEQEQHQIDHPEHPTHQLATLFLALSYLKEASTLPLNERASYYQLAHFYFRKTQLEADCYEQQRVTGHLEQELMTLFHSSLSSLPNSWCLALLHLLQDWQGALTPVIDLIAQDLVYETSDHQKHFFNLLKEEFQGTRLYAMLCDSFVIHFEQAIYRDSLPSFCHLWETLSQLCSIRDPRLQELAKGVFDHLLKTLYWDDTHLSSTQRLVELYLTLLPQNQELLASALLQQSFQLWGHTGQEEKGLLLMDIALTMSNHNDEVKQQLEVFLKDLFVKAEANNLLSRLALIHDALTHFQINLHQDAFTNHAKIVNHLADATYLYEARNYLAAQTHAAWVLKLDPDNHDAQQLMGLTCFQLGRYEQAVDFLQRLSTPDLYVQQALAFAHAYTKQKQKEHIAQINDLDSFNDDD